MRDADLYTQILGLREPWQVDDVSLDRDTEQVTVHVTASTDAQWSCPKCGAAAPGYDRRTRRWRHLDTMQYYTILEALVPRVRCPEHGVASVEALWASSLDFAADSALYAISFLAIGWSLRRRSVVALIKGVSLAVMGVVVLITAIMGVLASAAPACHVTSQNRGGPLAA
jgi:hypothetical protein